MCGGAVCDGGCDVRSGSDACALAVAVVPCALAVARASPHVVARVRSLHLVQPLQLGAEHVHLLHEANERRLRRLAHLLVDALSLERHMHARTQRVPTTTGSTGGAGPVHETEPVSSGPDSHCSPKPGQNRASARSLGYLV